MAETIITADTALLREMDKKLAVIDERTQNMQKDIATLQQGVRDIRQDVRDLSKTARAQTWTLLVSLLLMILGIVIPFALKQIGLI